MKNVFLVLALILTSTSVFANPIPKEKLIAYKEAVNLALANKNFTCSVESGSFPQGYVVDNLVKSSTSGEVSNNGLQPLLAFKQGDQLRQIVVSITTTADYKSIMSLKVENIAYQIQEINSGNLKNPSISQKGVWQSTAVGFCRPEK